MLPNEWREGGRSDTLDVNREGEREKWPFADLVALSLESHIQRGLILFAKTRQTGQTNHGTDSLHLVYSAFESFENNAA